jgi:transposase
MGWSNVDNKVILITQKRYIVIQLDKRLCFFILVFMSYSIDLRKRVIDFIQSGNTQKKAQEVFQVGSTTIKKWLMLYKTTGNLCDPPLNRSFKKINPEVLLDYIKEHPDAYLREIAEFFCCSVEGVRRALNRHKLTLKKNDSLLKNAMKKSVTLL